MPRRQFDYSDVSIYCDNLSIFDHTYGFVLLSDDSELVVRHEGADQGFAQSDIVLKGRPK